jgi:hypothetical protein
LFDIKLYVAHLSLPSNGLLFRMYSPMADLYHINLNWRWSSTYLLGLFLLVLSAGIYIIPRCPVYFAKRKTREGLSDHKHPTIIPLEGFNWENTEPLQFRPFQGKDKYNLTMGEMAYTE